MTHRPCNPTPQQSRSPPCSSHEALSSSKHAHTQLSSHIKPADMVQSHLVLHILEILGVFVCAHHLWPKGVTYGEAEDWEIEHRKRHGHGHGPHSKSKSKNNESTSHTGSSSDGVRRNKSKREERVRDYEYEYEERPRHSRHASSRY